MVATMNTLVADLWSVDAIVDFIVKRKRRSQTVLCSTWISFCNWKVFPCVYGAGATQARSCCSLWNGWDLENPAGVAYQHHLAPPELLTFVRICLSCSLCVCWLESPIAALTNQHDGLWVTGDPEGWSSWCASCDQAWNCVEKVATKDGSFWVELYQASENSIATSVETDVEGWRN